MRLSRKPYAAFWDVRWAREVVGPHRGRMLGVYLPGFILWFRRPDPEAMERARRRLRRSA